jgi:hypothetical protein
MNTKVVKQQKKTLKGAVENHALLYTGKGLLGLERASFMGPGTNLTKRLKMNSKPKSYSDTVSQAHDIRYGLAEDIKDIRVADMKFLKSLDKAKKEKLDYKVNIIQGHVGIKTKVFLEDRVGVSPEVFTSFGIDKLTTEEINLYKNKLKELEQKGFGLRMKCKF